MAPTTYQQRRHLFTSPETWTLAADGLQVQSRRRRVRVPYTSIRSVRLCWVEEIYTCSVRTRRGRHLLLASRSFTGLGRFVEHRQPYLEFVRALHQRLLPVAGQIEFQAGSHFTYRLMRGLRVVALLLIAAIPVAVGVAVLDDRPMPWRILASLAPLAATAAGVEHIARRPPGRYHPDALPADLLPPDAEEAVRGADLGG